MAELTVDITYGTALLEAARETGKEEQIKEEGFQVVDILEKEDELQKFIAYPAISAAEKKKVIGEIFEGRVCNELLNFMYILVDKRRAGRFESIMKVYRELLEREEGVSYGTAYSVVKLSDERLRQLEEQTSRLMRRNVKLTNEIDATLMAGVKVLVEGKIIDASYRKKFDEMAVQLKAN